MKSPSFSVSSVSRKPFPLVSTLVARARAQIQAYEDKKIFEILDAMSCCVDPSKVGICERCGLPVNRDGTCPMWDVSLIMES